MTNSHALTSLAETATVLPGIWVAKSRGRAETPKAPMLIGAVYARYSTDRQTETSIERQYEMCEEHAARVGVSVNWRFTDRARAGTTVVGRIGLEDMLEAARKREFGILILENVDRLSRDLSDLSRVFKELTELGIEIHQPGRGKLGLPDIAFQGFMGQEGRRLFLERTQRGRIQKARLGRAPSKVSFGYSLIPGRPGERVIDEAQAATVREIYQMRMEGLSRNQIAKSLNKRLDQARSWTTGGVDSVLRNALYAGIVVYNQTTRAKDETGMVVSIARPRSEWVITPVEHLRIVEQALWEAVQELGQMRQGTRHKVPTIRRKYLLSGKLNCPECGRIMTVGGHRNDQRFHCQAAVNNRQCQSGSTFRLAEIERLVIELVAEHVLDPRCTEAYATAYDETRQRSANDHEAKRSGLRREIDGLNRELQSTFDQAVTRGFDDDFLVGMREAKCKRVKELKHELDLLPNKPPRMGLEPGRIATLRDAVMGMTACLPFQQDTEADLRLAAAFSDLIKRIVPRRTSCSSFDVEVQLTVMPLLNGASTEARENASDIHFRASFQRKSRFENHSWTEAYRIVLDGRRYALREHEWDAISHLLPYGILLPKGSSVSYDARMFVEAHLFLLMSGAPWSTLPDRFGRRCIVYMSLRKLIGLGIWREVCTILTSLDPDRYQARYAEVTCKSPRLGRSVVKLVEERRAAEAQARMHAAAGRTGAT